MRRALRHRCLLIGSIAVKPHHETNLRVGTDGCVRRSRSATRWGRPLCLHLQDFINNRKAEDHDRHIAARRQTAASTRTSKVSLLLQLAPRDVKGSLVRIVIADLQCGLALCRRNNPLSAFHSPDAIFANKEQLL